MKKSFSILLCMLLSVTLRAGLIVDDAESGSMNNSMGGYWVTYDDGFSVISITTDTFPAYEGNYCKYLHWKINAGASYPITGTITSMKDDWTGMDLSSYYGVRFYARGNGRYSIKLRTDSTSAGGNHYNKEITLIPEWKLYELPFVTFRQTWGDASAWDPSTLQAIEISAVASPGDSGEIFIDNIEFILKDEGRDPNIIIPFPKVNQVGYLTGSKKYFCVTTDIASDGDTYFILDQSDNIVKTGTLSGTPFPDTASTGEFVWKVDFSDVTIPGNYKVSINTKESYSFTISDSVFNTLFRDALRCFYLIRCGIAENDPVTGLNKPACHQSDALIRGGTGSFDATGGWHNAGDAGKFVNETAISIAYMLWLCELRPDQMEGLNLQIPESNNQITDILDEARWGLTWLLKMQKADSSIYHKVDEEPNIVTCEDIGPCERYAEFQKYDEPQTPSTIDAAVFTAVMSQAARVFSSIDSDFSAQCLEASKKAWEWLNSHTKIGQSDPAYPDAEWWDEYLWAEGEMARTLNSNSLRTHFSATIDTAELIPVGWGNPQLFGYISLYFDNRTGSTLKDKIKSKIMSQCYAIEWIYENTGYALLLDWWEYWWESNEWLMSKANLLLFGYEMSGDERFRDAAIAQLNYMLGLNSLNKSFVMNHGTNFMKYPFNWVSMKYGTDIPGWCAGGANSNTVEGYDYFLSDLIRIGTPPAKCYVDTAVYFEGSWASNEGETSENAVLAFLSGYFYKNNNPDPVNAIPEVSVERIAVYPTPCCLQGNCKGVTFTGLPAGSALTIYDMNGSTIFSIKHVPADGKLFWNLTGNNSIPVIPGVYIYSVNTNRGEKQWGKVVII